MAVRTILTSNREVLARLAMALATAIASFLAVRYIVLGGGVHRIAYPWPSGESLFEYLWAVGEYLTFAVLLPADAPVDWIAGAFVCGVAWWCIRRAATPTDETPQDETIPALQSRYYVAGLAVVATVAGFAPYMLVFSTPPTIVLHGGGRYFSSAAYGLALLMALAATSRRKLPGPLGKVVLAGYVGLNAAFLLGIGHRWEGAADAHCKIWRAFLDRVPSVADNATFLFLDLETSHRGATVIGESAGTRFLLPLLYGHRRWNDLAKVAGYHLASFERDLPPSSERRLTVEANGLMIRGRNPTQPIDPGRVILVRRDGERMVVLDRIAKADNLIAANWLDGVGEVRTNRDLILAAPPDAPSIEARLAALSIKCR